MFGRRSTAIILPVAIAAAAAVITTGIPARSSTISANTRSAADEAQPWRNPGQPAEQRAKELLAVLTQDEKIDVALDDLAPLAKYGIPLLGSHDGPNGIGLPGTTAFTSSLALAATFDTGLAGQVGTAIATELRGKGRNVWLGPAADIARNPLAGRLAETLGEDPYLTGEMASAESAAAKQQHVIVTVKHYVANNQEYGRTGFNTAGGGRTDGVNVEVSERALQEIYEKPFQMVVTQGGADAVMCSYNSLNGPQACQNPGALADIKKGFGGIVTPDFYWAVRDQAAAANAGVDLPQYDQGNGGRTAAIFTSGQVSQARLDDIVLRTLYTIFDSGVFDDPVGAAQDVVSTPENRALAAAEAARSMVLLKNNGVLPLSAASGGSIAVIGPSGDDAIYTEGGSAAVPTTVGSNVTPLAGITARAGRGVTVTAAQGSAGDAPATDPVPASVLTPSTGSGTGLTGTYWDNDTFSGTPALTRTDQSVDLSGTPTGVTGPFSVRWTGALTPAQTGLYRFSMLTTGIASMKVNGRQIASGYREGESFIAGPAYPIQGTVRLTAGKPVSIEIDYAASLGFRGGDLKLTWQTPAQSQVAAAVAAARQANVAIVFADAASGEGMDRSSLSLPGDQDELIDAVARANPRTIVVLNTGGPVLMPWLNKVAGVVEAWYPGQEYGTAIASVLFGDTDPSGRLPMTFPASGGQGAAQADPPQTYPGTGGSVSYGEGIYVGYRWYDKTGQQPLFPFGYGLSYTTFGYQDARVTSGGSRTAAGSGDQAGVAGAVHLTVANTGRRDGTSVVQVYVGHLPTATDTPARQLAGFTSVAVKASSTRDVTIDISRRSVSYYDDKSGTWVTPAGQVPVYVGQSLENAQLAGYLTVS